jgi:Peptidase A4 family
VLNTPDCTSTDPNVFQTIRSVGDTSECTFTEVIEWGDGTSSSKTFNGGSDTELLALFTHTYPDRPGTYTVQITGETTVGTCGALTGTNEFTIPGTPTHQGCPDTFSTPAAPAHASFMVSRAQDAEGGIWIGYVAVSAQCTFGSVIGQWVQPAITCPCHDKGEQEASFWVGLDGSGSPTVEQTGIQAGACGTVRVTAPCTRPGTRCTPSAR